MIAYGPIPSRRLGRSLGVNTISAKSCSFDCVYCQVGETPQTEAERRAFHPPDEVVASVRTRLAKVREHGGDADILSIVPDGEPTLDLNLGAIIDGLRGLGLPVAVFTNGSLLWRPDVRAELARADWVSLKMDAATERPWRRMNRPWPGLELSLVLEGGRAFAASYSGTLVTETLLLDGVNDGVDEVIATAEAVALLAPSTAYVGVPTRPTPLPWARPAGEEAVTRAYAELSRRVAKVELLTGIGGTSFGFTGDIDDDLSGALSVHPMREDQVQQLLADNGVDAREIDRLLAEGRLKRITYDDRIYYVLPHRSGQ